MKKINFSIINIIIGVIIIASVLFYKIENEVGMVLFTIGIIFIISGIVINKKLREAVVEFIINFI